MSTSVTEWILSGLELVALITVLAALQQRRIRASFPIFFNYIAATLLMLTVLLVSTLWTCPAYFYIYWSLTALNTLLVFGVLYEVFVNVMKPYSAVIDLGKMLFRWAAIFLLFTALLTAINTSGSSSNRIAAALQLLERSCDLMQCGLLLLLVIFQSRLGLSWRSRGMCIALGLGTYAAFDMSMWYALEHFPNLLRLFSITNQVVSLSLFSFIASVMMLPEPERRNAQDSPQRLILQRWNDVLGSYGYAAAGGVASTSMSDSFIPGVEQAVERVMSRKMVQ